jgi:hypothetical protein
MFDSKLSIASMFLIAGFSASALTTDRTSAIALSRCVQVVSQTVSN